MLSDSLKDLNSRWKLPGKFLMRAYLSEKIRYAIHGRALINKARRGRPPRHIAHLVLKGEGEGVVYNAMENTGSTNPMSNEEIFWKHQRNCVICAQHPQSVASFFFGSMCNVGRGYAEALGMFKNAPQPHISDWDFYLQDSAGYVV